MIGALFLALAFGFAWGSRDIFHNLINYFQSNQTLEVGKRIKFEDFEGEIVSMDKFHVTLKTNAGRRIKIPNSMIAKVIIEET